MNTTRKLRITAVQATPAYLDREATLDIVVDEITRPDVLSLTIDTNGAQQ